MRRAAHHPGRAAPVSFADLTPWDRCAMVLAARPPDGAHPRAVFRLALRQTEGLIGSIIGLLGLALAVPDHSALSRRAKALEVPRPQPRRGGEPLHLLVDSTGLRGAGEWLLEKHGAKTRRSLRPRAAGCFADGSPKRRWRRLHLGLDGDSGQIVRRVAHSQGGRRRRRGRLLARSSHGRGGLVHRRWWIRPRPRFHRRRPAPPRGGHRRAAARDRRAERDGRDRAHAARPPFAAHRRARAHGLAESLRLHEAGPSEAAIGRWKQVIGDGLRSRTGERRATEVDVAVHALNRMLEFGRPISVRTA